MDNICIPPSKYTVELFNIALHVAILFTILSLLFILYISKLSSETLNSELKHNISNAFDGLIQKVPTKGKETIRKIFKSISLENTLKSFEGKDEYVTMYNKMLFRILILVNIVLFVFVILAITLLKYNCNQCIPIGQVVKENVATFALVGVVEYLFFTKVAFKFIPTKPSTIVTETLDNFKQALVK